jgi:hypothetical protein
MEQCAVPSAAEDISTIIVSVKPISINFVNIWLTVNLLSSNNAKNGIKKQVYNATICQIHDFF